MAVRITSVSNWPVMGTLLAWDRRMWVKVLIIAGSLGLTASLASARTPQVIWLEGLIALGALLSLIRWPRLALGFLIVGSVLVPFGVGTGSQTTLNVSILLVAVLTGLWIVDMMLSHDLSLVRSRTIRPLLALIAVSLVAFVNGVQPWIVFAQTAPIRAQLGGMFIFILSASAFILFGHRVRDYADLRKLTWAFLALAALCALDQFGVPLHLTGFFVGDGSMFWLWMVVLAFSQAVINRTLGVPWRILLLGLVGAYMGYALLRNRDWTSGWAPELLALVAILWIGRPRLAMVGSVLALAAMLPKLVDILNLLLTNNEKNQYDLLTRTAAWEIMAQIIQLNPLLGIGFANYYHYTPLYRILGYAVEFNSHNNYIDILAQTGILGMACVVWFFAELFWLGWNLRTRAAAGFPRAYVIAVTGAIPAMLVAAFMGDWVLPFVYNVGLRGFRASVLAWLFMGGILVIERQTRRAEQAGARAQVEW
jgi:O-antigen ligase